MNQQRQGIEMRRYAIVNAVVAAAAALVLVLVLHEDPAASGPPAAAPRAPVTRADAPPVRRSLRIMLKRWSTS